MSEVVTNVDISFEGVSVKRPIIDMPSFVRCRTGEVKYEKQDDGTVQLVIPLTLEAPATTTDKRELPVGYKVTHFIGVTAKGKRTATMIGEEVGRFQCAALNLPDVDPSHPFAPGECSGKLVDVRFEARPDKADPAKVYQNFRYYAVK